MEAARLKWNCQHQAVRGQGWWYGQHMQTFMKRRDVQGTKDADWFLYSEGAEVSESSAMGDRYTVGV
jgi:hypothetical protein